MPSDPKATASEMLRLRADNQYLKEELAKARRFQRRWDDAQNWLFVACFWWLLLPICLTCEAVWAWQDYCERRNTNAE